MRKDNTVSASLSYESFWIYFLNLMMNGAKSIQPQYLMLCVFSFRLTLQQGNI